MSVCLHGQLQSFALTVPCLGSGGLGFALSFDSASLVWYVQIRVRSSASGFACKLDLLVRLRLRLHVELAIAGVMLRFRLRLQVGLPRSAQASLVR